MIAAVSFQCCFEIMKTDHMEQGPFTVPYAPCAVAVTKGELGEGKKHGGNYLVCAIRDC